MDDPRTELFSGFNPRVVLHNFFTACKRLIWVVLAAALAFGFYSYRRADQSYSPYYASEAVFSVRASYYATTDILSYSTFMNSTAAQTLSATFPYIIRSENTQRLLKQELDMNYIPGTINATSTADAALFTLTVTSSNAQHAYDLLQATIKVYPQAASTILGDTTIDVINMPIAPSTIPMNENNALEVGIRSTFPVIAIGLILIFLLALSRKTVHSAEDLRKLVNLKCLSYIPSIKLKKRSQSTNMSITITNRRVGSIFSESVRNLRVKVQKAMDHRHAHILLVSSTIPNEGKTTVATNLALSFAAEGSRVVLIDGDLRKQSLKAALGIEEHSEGLVEFLSDNSKSVRLLSVPHSTLYLLSGDKTTDQPQPLLDTPRLKKLFDSLREHVDYIIIDTPPTGILSDAATIAKYADCALYVVRQDLASSSQIFNALQTLNSVDIPLLGCVLNHTQAGTTRYGYGSKYSGSYGYSYGYKYSDSYRRYGYGYGYGYGYSRKEEKDDTPIATTVEQQSAEEQAAKQLAIDTAKLNDELRKDLTADSSKRK
ncbi:MAG: polysaccharide biosynthesis tyrosine autokinase [Oscillospiraceae bacterium]|nr:polysaccharide biosynthesis tyrosine autokinase [Oscillospiraceae bacterium]